MPKLLTLFLFVALAVITITSTGCTRCGELGYHVDHCDGDTQVVCDGRRLRKIKCGSGSTCAEAGEYGNTECVDDSLTPCEETACSDDASEMLYCADSGYVRTRECESDEACTPFATSFGTIAECLKLTEGSCTPPRGACVDDGQQVLHCNPITRTLVEGGRCSIDERKICASTNLGTGCADESLERCTQNACAPDGHTRLFCSSITGLVSRKLDCAPGNCIESDEGTWIYPRCIGG